MVYFAFSKYTTEPLGQSSVSRLRATFHRSRAYGYSSHTTINRPNQENTERHIQTDIHSERQTDTQTHIHTDRKRHTDKQLHQPSDSLTHHTDTHGYRIKHFSRTPVFHHYLSVSKLKYLNMKINLVKVIGNLWVTLLYIILMPRTWGSCHVEKYK